MKRRTSGIVLLLLVTAIGRHAVAQAQQQPHECLHNYDKVLLLNNDTKTNIRVCDSTQRQNQQRQRDEHHSRREAAREEHQRAREERRRKAKWNDVWNDKDNDRNAGANFRSFLNKTRESMTHVLPSQKPPHIVDGAWNAVKSIALGAMAGTASVIVFPVVGYRQSGVKGIVVGSIVGSTVGSTVTIVAFANGAYQLLAGAMETPSAVAAIAAGKVWDQSKREWIMYSLTEEDKELLQKGSQSKVKDSSYYDLLGVPFNASSKDIRKAYYRAAKDVHPDKRPDDPDANEQFLRLHAAYQTLSDERLRANYDKFGTKPSDSHPLGSFDVSVFFSILFDSQPVEPYVGELRVSFYTNQLIRLSQSEGSATSLKSFLDSFYYEPKKRLIEIAKTLVMFVDPLVNTSMSEDEFRVVCRAEANKIAHTAFGREFLSIIGSLLSDEAAEFLGFHSSLLTWPVGFVRRKKKQVRRIIMNFEFARKTWIFIRGLSVEGAEENSNEQVANRTAVGEQSESERGGRERKGKTRRFNVSRQKLKDSLPAIMDMAWAFINSDLSHVFQGVCWRIFADSKRLGREERLRRARALRLLGEEFSERAKTIACHGHQSDAARSQEINRRVERAFRIAMGH